jgi:hypothetical protein
MLRFPSYLLIFFAFIENSFFNYFGRNSTSSDIYLFFTHLNETFKSYFQSLNLFISSFLIFIFSTIFLRFILKYNGHFFLILLLYLNSYAFNFINSYFHFYLNLFSVQEIKIDECKELKILKNKNKNIVLIIGESLRSDKVFTSLTPNLNELNLTSKIAISGATNTDVSLPLLLNNAINPLKIDKCKNLFKLAKNANFKTYFFSAQSKQALKYIDKFLATEFIDVYKNAGENKQFDDFLIKNLKEIDLNGSNFIVLQLYGQHSPYENYPKEFEKFKNYHNFKDKINSKYNNSLLYSDFILSQIIKFFENAHIIFTSDHGEFLGEDGKYGHNQFNQLIYQVPFFIYSKDLNILNLFENDYLITHNEISSFIIYLLGYDEKFTLEKNKKVIVNGTMINREDGYLELLIDGNKILKSILQF